jgi:glycine betaine/proline transport system ATP-binding protein
MPTITVDNLYKVFGDTPDAAFDLLDDEASKEEVREETGCTVAVRDASFTVQPKEIFVVMGLSGSGKSTLLRCLNRLIEPTRGTVHIDEIEVTGADEERLRELRRSKMSMVFQRFGLFPHRSVIGNVEYGLEVGGMSKEERREKAREKLKLVGLEGYEESNPSELSGGMQQRVGLARALANDPEILLMDEAFSALDPLIRADMQDELVDLQDQTEATIVFITHDLDEALKLGDRIAIMNDGRIVQVGTAREILTDPADEYVRSFVQNVDRTEILTASTVMTDLNGEHTPSDDDVFVSEDTPVKEVLPLLLQSSAPILVRNGGEEPVGMIDREAVTNEMLDDIRAREETDVGEEPEIDIESIEDEVAETGGAS